MLIFFKKHTNIFAHFIISQLETWIVKDQFYSTQPILMTQKQLEIVDQWSTRIPLPHRRGWQWAMGGLQLNIVQNHKAAILKAT